MEFPILTESFRIKRLEPPDSKLHMVLDTDTYNEVDDQFAVVYALFSPEKLMSKMCHTLMVSTKEMLA